MKTLLAESEIKELIIHFVGNKSKDEALKYSVTSTILDDLVCNLMSKYFLKPFAFNERYSFTHDLGIEYNAVYSEIKKTFNGDLSFVEFSKLMARHLYETSVHPNIKPGELYVVKFENCIIDGTVVNGIGFFKSENKETYLKVYPKENCYDVQPDSGININALDKGCIVLNYQSENGYVVYVVDKTNKSADAKFWTSDFLGLKRKNDSYTQTQNAIAMCKNFISQLPSDIDKADKAVMMNRVVDSLKQESVNIDTVAERAFGPEHSAGFNSFRKEYQETHEVSFDESFQGKPEAIKRRATGTMTTIKLDKNFDVNIHGGEQFIERGYDEEKGMRYYKLFFNEEK